MTHEEYNELMREADLLRGNINKMIVTGDEKELLKMYEAAEIRLQKIHKVRVKELDRRSEEKKNCLECEEYNHEKHYCPKFCDVIREAVKDIRKDSIPVSYIEDTIKWAKENGSNDYADYLSHLVSVWVKRKEE